MSSSAADVESLFQQAFVASTAPAPAPVLDDASVRILDATAEELLSRGVQRTTMDDVARRAGVSRITVYRRFATKDLLVEQVVLREFRSYFEHFITDIAAARSVEERVCVGFVSSLRAIRSNRLIGALLSAEPGALVTSMVGEQGEAVSVVGRFVAGQLRAEQRAGTIGTEVDVDLVAEMMVRVSASFLTVPSRVVDVDDDEELHRLAEQFLVPMLRDRS